MTERPSSQVDLGRVSADYEAAKARLAQVGFTCEGSLICRYTTCNNPNCRCADPEQRHGPYWQLSWKHAGKTVSRILPADDAVLYQEWIANRRLLEAAQGGSRHPPPGKARLQLSPGRLAGTEPQLGGSAG